jgi:hypothetical protein
MDMTPVAMNGSPLPFLDFSDESYLEKPVKSPASSNLHFTLTGWNPAPRNLSIPIQ